MTTASPEGAGTAPAPVSVFDLANYNIAEDAEKGATFNLRDPKSGLPSGVLIDLYGQDSPTYRRNLRRGQDQVAANPEREPTDEDTAMLLGRARNAAAAVRGWQNMVVNGETVEFSYEVAVELFTKYHWIADQVLLFVNYRGNF